MEIDGRAVANFILDYCESKNRPVTNLSLQKIVYFCHVWTLVKQGHPLIKHQFEAWQYGPVLQYLYREFKEFDRKAISSRATEIDPDTGKRRVVRYNFPQSVKDLLETTVDFYSRLRAGDLVELTHAEGSPWHEVWHHAGAVNPGMKIGNDAIIAYYSKVPAPNKVQ